MLIHRVLLRLAPAVAQPIGLCVATGVALSIAQVTQAVLLGLSLAEITTGGVDKATPWISAFAVTFVVRALLAWVRERVVVIAGTRITASLRERLVVKLLDSGPLQLTQDRTGRLQSTMVDGVEGLDAYYSRYLPQVVIAIIVPFSIVVGLATMSGRVAIVLGIAVLAVLTIPRIWDAVLLRRGKQHWDAFQTLTSDFVDGLQGLPSLRVAGAAERVRDELEHRTFDLFRRTIGQLRLSLVETGITALLVNTGTAFAVLIAAHQAGQSLGVATGATLAPENARQLLLVLVLAGETFRPIRELAQHWHSGYLGLSAVDGIKEILELVPAASESGSASNLSCVGAPEIRFEGVSARYAGRSDDVVSGIDLTIAPGSFVAIVGPSGAGKSTLAGLLLRWLEPASGRILINGTDISTVSLTSLRDAVAAVFQDTYLFTGSVASNLRIASPASDLQSLYAAAGTAGIHDEIMAMPDGYDTWVGERGTTLSGGQRQRLAIARAVLRDAPVLVLDEPTSSVDVATERTIVESLERMRDRRTTIVIAHRLSTIRSADVVVVMDGGCIVEHGTYDDLSRAGGRFSSLLNAQTTESSEKAGRS